MIHVIEYKGYIIDYIPKRKGYRVYWGKHCFDYVFETVELAKQQIDRGI